MSVQFVSSGVLIDRDVILTTAHNVDRLAAEDLLVRLGENNVQADPKRKFHHVNARVSRVLIKDDFNQDTLENDFAVLCLDRPVRCNEVRYTLRNSSFSPPLSLFTTFFTSIAPYIPLLITFSILRLFRQFVCQSRASSSARPRVL